MHRRATQHTHNPCFTTHRAELMCDRSLWESLHVCAVGQIQLPSGPPAAQRAVRSALMVLRRRLAANCHVPPPLTGPVCWARVSVKSILFLLPSAPQPHTFFFSYTCSIGGPGMKRAAFFSILCFSSSSHTCNKAQIKLTQATALTEAIMKSKLKAVFQFSTCSLWRFGKIEFHQ